MFEKIFIELATSVVIEMVVLVIVMDTIFGVIRAIKEHSFNSSVGIDGAIRKISMLISLVGLQIADLILHINLIGFVPQEAREFINLNSVGLAEFFGLLYFSYEVVSVLKNMTLCGLPVRKLWEVVRGFLDKYTKELPSEEEKEGEEIEKDIS
jgi:toxin secretion/phage lysis holin